MKISVIGAGYVGLVTGLGLAEIGHQILCYDFNSKKISQLKNKKAPFFEAKVQALLNRHSGKRIRFTESLQETSIFSDVFIICIGLKQSVNGATSIKEVIGLIKKIDLFSVSPALIIIKSTLPVGTHNKIENYFNLKQKNRLQFVTNPEFLSEGDAVNNFLNPHQIIIGTKHQAALKIMKKIYRPISKNHQLVVQLDPTTAELTKHATNCMLATKISFIHEISRLCEITKANIDGVKKGLSMDPRIGPHFINTGPGYGGSCLPKDITSLILLGTQAKESLHLLRAVQKTNQIQTQKTYEKIKKIITQNKIKRITVWGVSYKAGTDDIRNSAALKILTQLLRLKLQISVFDPAALPHLKNIDGNNKLLLCKNHYPSLDRSELLIILTEWPIFKSANLLKIKAMMKSPLIFDAKNIFLPADVIRHGIKYHSIGRMS